MCRIAWSGEPCDALVRTLPMDHTAMTRLPELIESTPMGDARRSLCVMAPMGTLLWTNYLGGLYLDADDGAVYFSTAPILGKPLEPHQPLRL